MLSHTRPYRAIPMKWQLFRKEAIFRGAQFAYGFMWLFFCRMLPVSQHVLKGRVHPLGLQTLSV